MENQNNGKAIASLVVGILSIVFLFVPNVGSIVGIVLAIIGIVLAIGAKKEQPSGMATAGFVLSVISLALCAFVFVACVACVGCIGLAGLAG